MIINNTRGVTGYSGLLRLSGLASGLDTDTLVQEMLRAERIPLDKLTRQKQLAAWRTDAYREITNLLRKFKDGYFDVLKPAANMLSQANYKLFAAAVTDSVTGSTSTALSVSGSVEAMTGEHTVEVNQLATAAKRVSAGAVTRPLAGAAPADFAAAAGKDFLVTVDGVTKSVAFNADGSDATVAGLNDLLAGVFGAGRVIASTDADGVLQFSGGGGTTRITLSAGTEDALGALQFTAGATNRLSLSMTMQDLAANAAVPLAISDGNVKFSINGKLFSFSQYESLGSVINQINGDAAAKVTLRYDELKDQFTLISDTLGANYSIDTADAAGNFLAALQITPATEQAGTDAKIVFDGVAVTRSTNNFTINGINLSLGQTTANPVTVRLTQDTDAVYDRIKAFIDQYNTTIDTINQKIAEPYDKDYQPLTDEQKEAMSEDEIKKWEEKAKTGLLHRDPILQGIVDSLRRALTGPIAGVSGDLSSIGITTGNYTERGKLYIDESKLRAAIQEDPDKVLQIFAKKSEIGYYDATNSALRTQRYDNEGIAQRFYDVIEDHIRTLRGADDKKGILLEKAGIEGDITEFKNLLGDDIKRIDKQIAAVMEKLARKEDAYYRKFTVLEQYMQQMNSQAVWLAQQFGGQ